MTFVIFSLGLNNLSLSHFVPLSCNSVIYLSISCVHDLFTDVVLGIPYFACIYTYNSYIIFLYLRAFRMAYSVSA